MREHRFRSHIRPNAADVTAESAFVPCPLFLTLDPAQQARIEAIYRIAAAQVRDQLTPPARYRPVEFSLN